MDALFALPPEDLSDVDDAALAELAAGLRSRVQEITEGRRDPEVVGDLSATEVASQMQEAVEAIERISDELATRDAEQTAYDDKLTELATRAGVKKDETTEGDGEGDQTDGGDDAEPPKDGEEAEAVVASSTPQIRAGLPAARRHRPVQQDIDPRGLRVTTHAAGLGSTFDGMATLDRDNMGEFLNDIVRRQRIHPGQKAVLARATYDYPADRVLDGGPNGHETNSKRIQDVVGPTALVASGGLCAPLTPIYDLPGFEVADRPVRNALASFQATRGGVQLGVTPKMGDYADAVGVVTDADNTAGGTLAVKNCMRIVCPDFNPTTVDSIYQCIEADNLASRAYPELMARIADLVMAEQARLADSKLLTAIKQGSTNITGGNAGFSAVSGLFGDILKAGAGMRSRNRMDPARRLQLLIPAWIIDLLIQDTLRAANQDNREATRAGVEALFDRAGINVTFYLDGPSTGVGQVFGAQTTGAVDLFPDHVQSALFAAGSWLHLDAGDLQLGVVRDSSLNATNDFQVFSETWENVAFTGVESLWITTAICGNGTYAAGKDASAVC